jgi:capsular exopolysaccharide synthesis family protein
MDTSLVPNSIRNSRHPEGTEVELHRIEAKIDRLIAAEALDSFRDTSEDGSEPAGLLQMWQVIANRKWTVISAALLFALAGFLLSLLQAPSYRARVSLEILERSNAPLQTKARDVEEVTFGPDTYLQTRVDLLQSDSLVRAVAARAMVYRDQLVQRQLNWRALLNLPKGAEPAPEDVQKQLQEVVKSNMQVKPSRGTSLVELQYDAPTPELAANLANWIADEFINQDLGVREKAAQRKQEWLGRQLEDVKHKLEDSESRLQRYAQASNLQFMGGKDNLSEEKLKQLEDELSKAQAARIQKQSQYEATQTNPSETITQGAQSGAMRDYQLKLTELRRELADLSALYTPNHFKVKRVQAQIAELEYAMSGEKKDIVGRAKSDYDASQAIERRLAAAQKAQADLVSNQKSKLVQYNVLQREVETNRNLYDAMLQAAREAGVNSALRAENARIVDPASPPVTPYSPKPLINTGAGLVLGLCLGMIFVVADDRVDRTVRSPGILNMHLNVPELGVIPSFSGSVDAPRTATTLLPLGEDGRSQTVLAEQGKGEGVQNAMVAEGFRSTLTSILFSGRDGHPPRVIVVTSCSPDEGKSTVACNIALAVAEIRQRVLLVGADMRNPRLHLAFGVTNNWGLSDLLRESQPLHGRPLEKLALPTPIPGIYVLPSGGRAVSTANLLHSRRMEELMARFRREFDMVLIDTPPMIPFADARVLARHADGVVLVVRAGRTTRDAVQAARQRLAEDGSQLLGTILNDWKAKRDDSVYYYSKYHPDAEAGAHAG